VFQFIYWYDLLKRLLSCVMEYTGISSLARIRCVPDVNLTAGVGVTSSGSASRETHDDRGPEEVPRATIMFAGLTALLALTAACGSSSSSGGPVTAQVTSCSFNAQAHAVEAQVVLNNGTGSDADLAAQVYWLTSVAPPGTFGQRE
jgi:hypothetical protein